MLVQGPSQPASPPKTGAAGSISPNASKTVQADLEDVNRYAIDEVITTVKIRTNAPDENVQPRLTVIPFTP